MKKLLAYAKKVVARPEKKAERDIATLMKHVDEQIGRAVARLAER